MNNPEGVDPRPILLISDLHLSPALPRTVNAFEHFIQHTASAAQALYILGDLFENWVGDDELVTPFAARVCAVLHSLSEHGIALYIMRGNRDFLLGPRFAYAAGAVLLEDSFVLHAFNQHIALAHGDALCTLDTAYQRFRRLTRQVWLQRTFLSAPLSWRLALARYLRGRSQMRAVPTYPENARFEPRWDVTPEAVDDLLTQCHTTTLIHGHTHRPAHHHSPQRWVLPDWELDQSSARGGYLQFDAQGLTMFDLNSLPAVLA